MNVIVMMTLLLVSGLSSFSDAFSVVLEPISTSASPASSWRMIRDQGAKAPHSQRKHTGRMIRRMMVRNIDLPEALIFYGADMVATGTDADSASFSSDSSTFQPGVQALLKECREIEATAIVIVEKNHYHFLETLLSKTSVKGLKTLTPPLFHMHKATQDAPNPRDVWEAIHNVAEIQPAGFGGSAGFGRKLADPTRLPLPKHTVVFCSNEQQCRAAIYAGMRVICLTDNDIADAVVDSLEDIESVDDIATPGSFWLNPPYARDDQNNKVDPLEVMGKYEHQQQREADHDHDNGGNPNNAAVASQDMADDDDEIARILADMDSLF